MHLDRCLLSGEAPRHKLWHTRSCPSSTGGGVGGMGVLSHARNIQPSLLSGRFLNFNKVEIFA